MISTNLISIINNIHLLDYNSRLMMQQARQVYGIACSSLRKTPELQALGIGSMLKAQWSVFQKLDVLKSIRAAAPHASMLWAVSLDKQRAAV
jgi:hypothetical protein